MKKTTIGLLITYSHTCAYSPAIYTKSRWEGYTVKKRRYTFTYDEWRLIIYALNNLRNSLIEEGKFTDTVDDALIAVANAKTKRVKVVG